MFKLISRKPTEYLLAPTLVSFCLLGYALLFSLVFARVFQDGICCADDALNATFAKNLAFGYGYGNSLLDYGSGIRLFESTASTGPILTLPAAALIVAFGNQPWVPGLITALTIALCMVAIALMHFRRASWTVASLYTLMFGWLCYALTPWHFEQWYSLIGEIPAALFCVLGATVASNIGILRGRPLASLLFGAAVMIKLLALLSCLPFLAWLCFNCFSGSSTRVRAFRNLLTGIAFFLTPFFAFELWKLASLGALGYVEQWKYFYTFVAGHSSLTSSVSLASLQEHEQIFAEHFGVAVPFVIAAGIGVLIIVWFSSEDRRATTLAVLLISATIVNLIWWLCFAAGWPRHILIGLVIYAAGLSTVVYALPSGPAAIAAVLIVILHISSIDRLTFPIKRALTDGLHESDRVVHLREAATFLSRLKEDRPFIRSWWATAADLEYIMPEADNFRIFYLVRPEDAEKSLILVRNTFWTTHFSIPEFVQWEERCSEILFDRSPFLISRCPPQKHQAD